MMMIILRCGIMLIMMMIVLKCGIILLILQWGMTVLRLLWGSI